MDAKTIRPKVEAVKQVLTRDQLTGGRVRASRPDRGQSMSSGPGIRDGGSPGGLCPLRGGSGK